MAPPLGRPPSRRSAPCAPATTLAAGGHAGTRGEAPAGGRDPARRSAPRVAEDCGPALRARRGVGARGPAPGTGRSLLGARPRRRGGVLPVAGGRRACPGGTAPAGGQVGPAIGTGPDPARRVRSVCPAAREQQRQETSRNHVGAGVSSLVPAAPNGPLPGRAAHGDGTTPAEPCTPARPAATPAALPDPRTGAPSHPGMVGTLGLLWPCRQRPCRAERASSGGA